MCYLIGYYFLSTVSIQSFCSIEESISAPIKNCEIAQLYGLGMTYVCVSGGAGSPLKLWILTRYIVLPYIQSSSCCCFTCKPQIALRTPHVQPAITSLNRLLLNNIRSIIGLQYL